MMDQPLLFDIPNATEDEEQSWFAGALNFFHVTEEAAWPDRFGDALREWTGSRKKIRTLSIFAGGGGLDIAFHDAGFQVIESVEIEEKFAKTLEMNSGPNGILEGTRVLSCDIREYHPNPNLDIDFIIGGPPCQTFSAAGRRASGVMGTNDARGTLFEEYVRLLETLKPRGFLFENVYGIIGAQGGEAWRDIQAAFKGAGYNIFHRILDAADYGVPQHRERLFIVGIRRDLNRQFHFPTPTHGPDSVDRRDYYTASEAVAGADTYGTTAGIGGRYGTLLDNIPPGLNYSFYTAEMGHPYPVFSWRSKFSDFLYKADPHTPIRTLKAQGGQYTGPFSWENRPFSLSELKRLQTFPDAYQLSGKRQTAIKQIGNSVPPQLGRILALAVRQQVMDEDLPFEISLLPPETLLGFRRRKRGLTDIYAQKARETLARLEAEGQLRPFRDSAFEVGQETHYLGEDFSWSKSGPGRKILVQYDLLDDVWHIEASSLRPMGTPAYVITVKPKEGTEWVIDAPRVQLVALDEEDSTFTALWKAFEERVHAVTGSADLVQLRSYYQYESKIVVSLDKKKSANKKFTFLSKVLSGIGVGTQQKVRAMAYIWGIIDEDTIPYLEYLKTIGYEVRNNSTNPQIPLGEYLVPYAFPTLTPRSIQLRKKLSPSLIRENNMSEQRLEVYSDRSVLVDDAGNETTFIEGRQSRDAQLRVKSITEKLKYIDDTRKGFLSDEIENVLNSPASVSIKDIKEEHINLLDEVVNSVTSEVGRGVLGYLIVQLCVKAIEPTQNIRLHKGGKSKRDFSWVEGISLRSVGAKHVTPILRKYGLIKANVFGAAMTRTLAENYPFSQLYKAQIRGAKDSWIKIIDALESNELDAGLSLRYVISRLINLADKLKETTNDTLVSSEKLVQAKPSFEMVSEIILQHVNESDYGSRVMEVAMHALMQVAEDNEALDDGNLVNLSQMRSANKKHGNIGDIEVTIGDVIIESWDAKFGKDDLREELEELNDKLSHHPNTQVAGFVTSMPPVISDQLQQRMDDVSALQDTEIKILYFPDWVQQYVQEISEIAGITPEKIGHQWLTAYIESLGQRREQRAPIDEPCQAWVETLNTIIKSKL